MKAQLRLITNAILQKNFTSLTKSESELIKLVFRKRNLTQSQLTQIMNVTQQSISRMIGSLIKRQLIQFGDPVSEGKRGIPSKEVRIVPDYAYSFGASILSDSVSIALMDFSGNVLKECSQSFSSMNVHTVVDWFSKSIKDLSAEFSIEKDKVCGMGVGISGSFINSDGSARFNTPFELEEWALIDVEDLLTKRLDIPVWVDNDGNTAALGESMIGVGLWADSFVYMYLAKGVGGGVVLNGELWRGKHGNAGEFAGGLPPNIYPFPNLELLRHQLAKNGIAFETVSQMIENYDPQWSGIDEWISRVRDSLSLIASNATAILDIDAVVLGGRIPRTLAEKVIPSIELYDQKRRNLARGVAKVVPSETSGDATAIGAALLPFNNFFFTTD